MEYEVKIETGCGLSFGTKMDNLHEKKTITEKFETEFDSAAYVYAMGLARSFAKDYSDNPCPYAKILSLTGPNGAISMPRPTAIRSLMLETIIALEELAPSDAVKLVMTGDGITEVNLLY